MNKDLKTPPEEDEPKAKEYAAQRADATAKAKSHAEAGVTMINTRVAAQAEKKKQVTPNLSTKSTKGSAAPKISV